MNSALKWILALGGTAAVSSAGSILVYRQLTVESDAFVSKQQDVRVAQAEVDRVAHAGVVAAGEIGAPLSGVHTFSVAGGGVSNATFTSDAPLETIVGNVTDVEGSLTVDLGAPLKTKGSVSVGIAGIETGIALRDEHLHGENWLDAEKFPRAEFVLKSVRGKEGPLAAGERRVLDVTGDLTLHGVTRSVDASLTVQASPWTEAFGKVRIKGDVLRVRGEFTVAIADFGIDAGDLGDSKVASFVTIGVNLTTVTEAPSIAAARE